MKNTTDKYIEKSEQNVDLFLEPLHKILFHKNFFTKYNFIETVPTAGCKIGVVQLTVMGKFIFGNAKIYFYQHLGHILKINKIERGGIHTCIFLKLPGKHC